MANIVQLEENGQLLYPKTHVKAVEGMEEVNNKINIIEKNK